jgi:hypothetical protein
MYVKSHFRNIITHFVLMWLAKLMLRACPGTQEVYTVISTEPVPTSGELCGREGNQVSYFSIVQIQEVPFRLIACFAFSGWAAAPPAPGYGRFEI